MNLLLVAAAVVLLSHAYMLWAGKPFMDMQTHNLVNLAAAALLVWSLNGAAVLSL